MITKFERYKVNLPQIVLQAHCLAEELGFPLTREGGPAGNAGMPSACTPEVGKLLSVLAAGYPNGTIGEFGTGAGVGTAWLVHGLPSSSRLISAEVDTKLVARTRQLFAHYPNVEIRQGNCFEVMNCDMPFDLLFLDADIRRFLIPENWYRFTEMVKIGGKIVFDDLTPVELWPPEWDGLVDQKREFAFHNPRLIGSEVRTTATQAVIIATRIS